MEDRHSHYRALAGGFHLYFNVCSCLFQCLLMFMSVLSERSFMRFDTVVLHVSFEVLFKHIHPHNTYTLTTHTPSPTSHIV